MTSPSRCNGLPGAGSAAWMMVLSLSLILLFSICSPAAWAWPVPDTGQMTCFDADGNVIACPKPGQALYGQDGNYTINAPSYTKLDENGEDLPDSAPSWAMVRDNVTGLIWEVKRNMDEVKHYDDPHDADNTYTWYDSNPDTNCGDPGTPGDGTDTEDFIKKLNNDRFGGSSDWRMPTIKDLASIADYGRIERSITNYFPNTWEIQYGLAPLDPADKDGDLDKDRLTNYEEFVRGSDPTDRNDPKPRSMSWLPLLLE